MALCFALGAACFLACALDTLHTGVAAKMPIRRRLRRLETDLEQRASRPNEPDERLMSAPA